MKARKANDHTLESLRYFQFVAWALVIGFTLFVYNIVRNLQVAVADLEAQSELVNYTDVTISSSTRPR